uniref:Signal recognition particle receptor subunit beta n=2 Tax=Dendroctonus ponderosae TaxID=77166 RepID=A0AAR5PFC5_DENPD
MTYEAILVAVLAIVITIVVFLVRRLLSSGKRYVLLTGLNDTGKTLIYSQLVYNRHVATFTSSQDNEGQFNTQKQNFVTLVDLPGFHSIRQQFFEKYKAASKGIVYVVDSVTLAQNVRDAANVLYNILIDPT